MKKKLIGLSMLLLVLLLGLSTNSYAFEYTVTNSDIDLIVDNAYRYDSWKNYQRPKIKSALNALYNTYGCDTIFISVRGSDGQIFIFGLDKSQITSVRNSTNVNYLNISFTGNIYRYDCYKSSQFSGPTTYSDMNNFTIGPGSQLTGTYLMYSNDLTSTVSGPWQSSDILTFSLPNYFTFIQNLNLDYSGDIALVSSLNDYLGVVSLGKNLDRIQTDYQYYDRYTKQWKIYHSEDLNFSATTDDDFYYYIRYAFNHREQYYLPNTLVQVYFVPKDTEEDFPTYFQPFYIVDRNTRYNTGGGVDLDDTFDDDSYWNYYIGNIDNLIDKQNTDKTTDDIINNDNENTDKIISTLTEFDSGDAASFVDFGDQPQIEDPTSNFITYLMNRISASFLNDYSNTYIDVPFLTTITRVYASDFSIPLTLKTLISALFIYKFSKRYFTKIHDLVTSIQTAKIGSFAEKIQGGLSVVDIL